jgi:hypothetical protein
VAWCNSDFDTPTCDRCYGLQPTPDGGYILTCGTGVEPELHPQDSAQSKTWRVLVHRTDAHGVTMWENCYSDNSASQSALFLCFHPAALRKFLMPCTTNQPSLRVLWRGIIQMFTHRRMTGQLHNNAGEFIITTRSGDYAVLADSQTLGSPSTGGNFAILLLDSDLASAL